jgi:stage III sporulation protein AA
MPRFGICAKELDMSAKETILGYFGEKLNSLFALVPEGVFSEITEIRVRVGKPLLFQRRGREYFLDEGGIGGDPRRSYKPSSRDIQETLQLMSDYSMYAFEEELRAGYITLSGGHRIGMSGQAVLEGGHVKTMKNISGFNIRISHEIKGCADKVLGKIAVPRLMHTMVISPPGCGKTTLLRDIARQLSDGVSGKFPGVTVGIVDERSEIAGCFRGVPQNDVGQRTDVLDGCPKAEGMLMLLRALSPRVIAVDELGGSGDIEAVEGIVNAGVCLVCTVHGRDLDEVGRKPALASLIGVFERFVTLSGCGKVVGICDNRGREVC